MSTILSANLFDKTTRQPILDAYRILRQGEFSRPFHWDEFWPAIKHGKDPQPEQPPR